VACIPFLAGVDLSLVGMKIFIVAGRFGGCGEHRLAGCIAWVACEAG
jgi:hypothetical protein